MVVVVVVVNTKPSGLAKAAAATAGNGSSWGFAAVRRKSCGRASGHTRRGRESMDVRDVIYGIGRRLVGFRESQLFCGWVFDFKSYDALTIGVTFVVYIWSRLRCPATAGSACTTDSDIWPDRAHEQTPCYPTPSGAIFPARQAMHCYASKDSMQCVIWALKSCTHKLCMTQRSLKRLEERGYKLNWCRMNNHV